MTPTHTELAEWSEHLAEARAERKGAISWWNSFYDELAEIFEHEDAELRGRRILLDEEHELRVAGNPETEDRRGPTVFFQPVRERAEGIVDIDEADDVRIPKTLRRRMVFLNPRLTWLERVGNTRRKKTAQQRPRTHQERRPGPARQRTAQRREQHSIRLAKLQRLGLSPQDRELVPQDQDLEFLRTRRPAAQHEQREQSAGNQIHERRQHARPPADGTPTLQRSVRDQTAPADRVFEPHGDGEGGVGNGRGRFARLGCRVGARSCVGSP